jgi:hypothetical protein
MPQCVIHLRAEDPVFHTLRSVAKISSVLHITVARYKGDILSSKNISSASGIDTLQLRHHVY